MRLRVPSLILLLAVPAACQGPAHRLQARRAEAVDVAALIQLAAQVRGQRPQGLQWLDDGHWLEFGKPDGDGPPQLLRVEAASGRREPFYDAAALEAALAADAAVGPEAAPGLARPRRARLLPDGTALVLQHGDGLWAWSLDGSGLRRLGASGAMEGERIAPDGRWIAFVRDQGLRVESLEDGRRTGYGGGTRERLAGRLDWVYQEEIYGRGDFNGFWWSPDSARVAFLELDESPVGEYRVEDHIPRMGHQELWRYPKAGTPNPRVQVGILPVSGGDPHWADLAPWPEDDRLLLQVDWTPDGRALLLQIANRIQNRLELRRIDAATGSARTIFEERSDSWVDRSPLTWLPDGGFLFQSDRTGWRHLYRFRADGTALGAVTAGEWEVLAVRGLAADGRAVLAETNEGDLLQRHLWRIPLDGGGRTRLTREAGTHRTTPSPGGSYAVDVWSRAGDPGATELIGLATGTVLRTLGRGRRDLLEAAGYRPPEFLEVPNRDGFPMEARVFKPEGFRPGRRYPVLVYTYGGPQAPSVRNAFGGFRALWHEALSDHGYLVWVCDNRSASGRGRQAAATMYRRAGETELADQEDGIAWLVKQGWADPQRIGIWGWSYGGFMVTYALTHSQRFRMGIAGAPVTDWRNYDTIYTERFMDTPEANPGGYERSSAVAAAADLHGDLLLVHGTLDENVHLANTLQLALALQEAGKPFEMMLYPKNRHGVGRPRQRLHLYRLMTAFVFERL